MAERDRAAVDVDDLLVGAEQPRRVERHRRERLVDLDPLDVVDRLPGLLERAAAGSPACARGRRSRRRRTPCETIVASTARARAARANSSLVTTTHEAPSFTPGALPAVVVPSGSKTGFSAASDSSEVSRRGPSSAVTSPTGDDLVVEAACVLRRDRALVRAVRPRVLLLARDPELAGDPRRLLRPCAARRSVDVSPSKTMRSISSPLPSR